MYTYHMPIVNNSKPSIFKTLLNKLIFYIMKITKHMCKSFEKNRGEKEKKIPITFPPFKIKCRNIVLYFLPGFLSFGFQTFALFLKKWIPLPIFASPNLIRQIKGTCQRKTHFSCSQLGCVDSPGGLLLSHNPFKRWG